MIEFPVVDAHIHIWDLNHLSYPWLENVPKINQTFLISDYEKAKGVHDVEAMVFVQCECKPDQYLDELNWVQAVADKESRLKGIVPWAPLEQGDVIGDTLAEMSTDSRVKGIRRIIQFEDNQDFCVQPGFMRGVDLLHGFGFHFELTISPAHFKNVIKLVDACPDTKFILDHIGNPDIINGGFESWYQGLKTFAESGPHFCKFSNLVCNADLDNWTMDDLKPYADAVIDVFGPDRLIWGSDWPHALRASTWERWYKTADMLTSQLSKEDRYKIFYRNAVSFYRLDEE